MWGWRSKVWASAQSRTSKTVTWTSGWAARTAWTNRSVPSMRTFCSKKTAEPFLVGMSAGMKRR